MCEGVWWLIPVGVTLTLGGVLGVFVIWMWVADKIGALGGAEGCEGVRRRARAQAQGPSAEEVAWMWSRYRAYRMEPGVHEREAEGIEAFLRWVEARDEATSAPD
mgnify:CR=1 FL=1